MKRILLSLAAMLMAFASYAQKFTVTGTVLDSLSRQSEPAAVVQFFKASDKSKPIAYSVTGEDGKFSRDFSASGDYSLMFSNLGRKTKWLDFTIEKDTPVKDLGEILVSDDTQALADAVVTAQRPLVKMEVDKMTYDVADDVDSKVSTVLDMLRKVPMVSVDAQDNITVNGSSSFLVTVDGKANPMLTSNASAVFKMMPAAAVKEIEVITNPGVKYDAEGVGGVLNLVTNKELTGGAGAADGYYATLRAQVGNRNSGVGAFASVQKGKFAISLDADLGKNKQRQYIDHIIDYEDGTSFSQSQNTLNKMKFGRASLNMSYELDSLNLFTATAGWMGFPSRQSGTEISSYLDQGVPSDSYALGFIQKYKYHSLNASADFQHSWAGKPGKTLTLSYQYEGTPTSTYDSRPVADVLRRIDSKANSVNHTVQLDFTVPVKEGHKISTGVKFISRHNFSDDDYSIYSDGTYVPAPSQSSEYDYYNRIGAIYGEYSGTVGKWGLKAGARYEHTWQKIDYAVENGQDFNTNYGDLVPSASLQYSFSPITNIGLSYNLRLSRPGITYLNPYVNKSNPMFWTKGNSDLDVAKSHNINLVYNFYSPVLMFNVSANFSHTGNGIEQYDYMQDGISIATYGNVVKSTTSGLSSFVNLNLGGKTRIYANMRLNYIDMRSSKLGEANSGWTGNIFAGAQETIFWDLRLSQNIMYSGRNIMLQGYMDGFSGAALSITKTFLNDKLSFSLNGFSPFDKDGDIRIKIRRSNSGRDGISAPYKTAINVRVPVCQFSFGVSWTFGGNPSAKVKKASRSIEKDDIVGASSSSGSSSAGATQNVGM